MQGRTAHVVVTAMAVLAAAAAGGAPPSPPAVKAKPDLVIQSFTAEQAGVTMSAHQVRLTVRVALRAAGPVSTGPFKILVEWREVGLSPRSAARARKGGWTPLPEAGVAGLTYDPASARVPSETRTLTTSVPGGKTYEFQAKVDSMGQVDEADETNNRASATYEATGCAGTDVDLEFVQMRLQRRPDGDTLVDVWIANRCTLDCVADIYYVIDDSGATGVPGSVERRIAVRVDGDSQIGPVGGTVARGIAGRDATYRVRIDPRGGSCPETTRVNNSCTGTILAGEASKIVDCRIPTIMPLPDFSD